VAVIIRASSPADLVHHDEIAALVDRHNGSLHEIIGPRHRVHISSRMLRGLVPDIAARDVYICGPEGFMAEIAEVAFRLDVPSAQIHQEAFGF
jgi:ferredoxin-NADP reductase